MRENARDCKESSSARRGPASKLVLAAPRRPPQVTIAPAAGRRQNGRNNIMDRRTFSLVLGLGAAAALAPSLAFAEDHLAEAIGHTKEAIAHGKEGHADLLVTHAEAALTHAEAAEKEKPNPHTAEGITHLKAAIEHGKLKHADVGTKHAEEALTHLEAAQK
ncbi:MAG: small metal-binding protein SmbP [Methylocystis sp.]